MRRTPKPTGVLVPAAHAVLCAIAGLVIGCSHQGSGESHGSGGNLAAGGTPGSGGQVVLGGKQGSGGDAGTAGTTSATGTGGASGGTTRTGGTAGGGDGTGGGAQSGGSTGAGGTSGSGGTTAMGGTSDAGVDAWPDVSPTQTGGTGRGGIAATGGVPANGGAVGTGGGGTGGGTSVGSDRCDVGVYDTAAPPKVLSLSGSLGCHDPSAIAGDGTYYAFCTGLGAETSTNLTAWKLATKPFGAPAWMTAAIPGVGDLWAPDISQLGGKFHLYYAGSTFGSNQSCIGHATRDSLATGSWTDDGAATICSNVGSTDNWNAIDPNLIIDTDGTPWLALGSFWSGLKVIQLDSSGKRVGTTVTSIANRPSNGGALEAPFMIRRCGYYYLFMSWDTCCKGADSTYNIRVVRGTSVTGPFADQAGTAALQGGGTLIAQGDATFAGPGGQSVMFVDKKAYLVYHAYAKSNGAITLRIAELVWDTNGWPIPVGP